MLLKNKKVLLVIGVIIVLILFVFSLFKNIEFPLLWNDEASTAMFGKRILEYGYPKVHDKKNSLYLFEDINHNVGIREGGDVYIAEGWTQYYLAAMGNFFAEKTNDLYLKTAMMRIPFALVGFLAIIIFGFTFSLFFKEKRLIAFIVFFLFELVSVSLVLHLKEVRYYSLILLFSAILLNFYLRYIVLKRLSYKDYVLGISLFIILLFHTFYPISIIFMITFSLHALILAYLAYEKKLIIFINNFLKLTLPILISLIFIIPSIIYFKTFAMSSMLTAQHALGIQNYIHNILKALYFFANFEFLYMAIFLKFSIIVLFLFSKKNIANCENKIITKVSNFLTLFFCVYLLVIAHMPSLFERYVIVLQPVLVGIILLDILLCWNIISRIFINNQKKRRLVLWIFTGIILIFGCINISLRLNLIKGHLYEMHNRYQGSLDLAISYIQEKYEDPSNIIIATNYEENSYMYYLRSKTIIGYVGNNLEEDKKLEPDVIIFRKNSFIFFGQNSEYLNIFNTFIKKNKYQEVKFPIYDYPFNNIPELYFNAGHLFKTKITTNENEKLYLYTKG